MPMDKKYADSMPTPAKIKAILWDNDGVLVNTEQLFYQANQEIFQSLGIALSEQHFFDWYLVDNCGAWHLIDNITEEDVTQLRQQRDEIYTRLLKEATSQIEVVGIPELVQTLAQQVEMGIVTASRQDHFDIIHAQRGLLPYFKFVLTHESVPVTKPHPAAYLLGLQQLNCQPEE